MLATLLASVLLLLPSFGHQPPATGQAAPPYEVHAIRYAHVPFPEASLVAGGDKGKTIDIAFTFWVARSAQRVVLVDAGFTREKLIQSWKPQDYEQPAEALKAGLGIAPDEVTDLVLTHVHWDHADGADRFPRAKIWIQREEYEHYVGPNGEALDRAIDPEVSKMLAQLKAADRVTLIDGDAREILPGITVYTGGKHTMASQYVRVATPAGLVVLASDNAYLYQNLERHVAIAQALDARSNLAAIERMLTLAAAPRLVVPGHDPAVFERFPKPGRGVAKIE
jgi:glyoxylase-like metal-dependent hydrolase (beta-lactamase superfamily II)